MVLTLARFMWEFVLESVPVAALCCTDWIRALPALSAAGARLQGMSTVLKSVLARDVVLLGFNYWSMYLQSWVINPFYFN